MKRRTCFKTSALDSSTLAVSGISACTLKDDTKPEIDFSEFEFNEITVDELQQKMNVGELSSINNVMTYLQSSPLYPLKGRITVNFRRNKLATITPLRGQGVSRCDNILFP